VILQRLAQPRRARRRAGATTSAPRASRALRGARARRAGRRRGRRRAARRQLPPLEALKNYAHRRGRRCGGRGCGGEMRQGGGAVFSISWPRKTKFRRARTAPHAYSSLLRRSRPRCRARLFITLPPASSLRAPCAFESAHRRARLPRLLRALRLRFPLAPPVRNVPQLVPGGLPLDPLLHRLEAPSDLGSEGCVARVPRAEMAGLFRHSRVTAHSARAAGATALCADRTRRRASAQCILCCSLFSHGAVGSECSLESVIYKRGALRTPGRGCATALQSGRSQRTGRLALAFPCQWQPWQLLFLFAVIIARRPSRSSRSLQPSWLPLTLPSIHWTRRILSPTSLFLLSRPRSEQWPHQAHHGCGHPVERD
jgi:hypothetical protein